MDQHHARHALILTDAEFFAVKRLDGNGRLALANVIPWISQFELAVVCAWL